MKKVLLTLMCMAAMMAAGRSIMAQEVTITISPGWNWISYPRADTMELTTAMGTFTPAEGDMIKSRYGFSEYYENEWFGNLQQFYPGLGYHYRSNRTEPVTLTFQMQQSISQVMVTTSEPTDITATSVVVGGTVTPPEGSHIFLSGVCWGTNQMPTVDDNHTSDGGSTNDFTTSLIGLTSNTTYYVRAYVVSDYGLAYGDEQSFTTLDNNNNVPEGAINGLFTINANGDQVYFSKGNLQYIGSASTPYWKFADNQWDVFGANGQNTEASDVDRDLFAWGTSGYDHGAICYQPWSMSTNTAHYYVYGNSAYNLYDQTGKADWGYNVISNGGNQENLWRTLMQTEWDYVMYRRSNAANLRYWAQVNGVNGMILLPDNWDNTIYTFVNGGGFLGNVINAENWSSIIEINGAVFLPVNDSNNYGHFSGHYWSSKNYAAYYALQLDFGINYDGSEVEEIWIETNNESLQPRSIHHSVRLVYKVDLFDK